MKNKEKQRKIKKDWYKKDEHEKKDHVPLPLWSPDFGIGLSTGFPRGSAPLPSSRQVFDEGWGEGKNHKYSVQFLGTGPVQLTVPIGDDCQPMSDGPPVLWLSTNVVQPIAPSSVSVKCFPSSVFRQVFSYSVFFQMCSATCFPSSVLR